MKIAIAVDTLDVDHGSGAKVNVALIANLHALGHDICVVHHSQKPIFPPAYPHQALGDNPRLGLYWASKLVQRIQYHSAWRLNKWVEQQTGFSLTHHYDVALWQKKLAQLLTDFQPEVILTLSQGGSFRPHKAMLGLPQWHDRWVAYVHDPYPSCHFPPPYAGVEAGQAQQIQLMQDITQKARWVGFPSLRLADWMQSLYPAIKDKIWYLPHQTPTAAENETQNPDTGRYPLVFLHAGNLLEHRNPLPLLQAFVQVRQAWPHLPMQLQCIGPYTHFEAAVTPYSNHPDIRILPYMPYKAIQAYERQAQVGIILEADAACSPFLPGKFPMWIRQQQWVLHLGPVDSEVRRLLGPDYPWVAPSHDATAIAQVLHAFIQQYTDNRLPDNPYAPDLVQLFEPSFLAQQLALLSI